VSFGGKRVSGVASVKELVVALPPSHQLAFMTACLSRAVEGCRPSADTTTAECLDSAVAMGWAAVAGKPPVNEERVAVHKRAERIGVRHSPQRGGRLELYHTANAATFVLGVLANPANLIYAPSAVHWVPNVLGAVLFPGHAARVEAECEWQLAVLSELRSSRAEPPTAEWFASRPSRQAEPDDTEDRGRISFLWVIVALAALGGSVGTFGEEDSINRHRVSRTRRIK
jgi:hypothetical protein